MTTATTTRHVTLVGETPLAKRLYGLLQGQGFAVRAAGTYDRRGPHADVVVEACGGLTPAYTVAMDALGQGIPCVTANPLLMMVHGKVLSTASRGQHAGLGATAALGAAAPLLGWLKSMPLRGLCMALPTAANGILTRMETRGEDFAAAEQGLSLQDNSLSDVSGKYTLTCMATLHGLVSGQWLAPQQATRQGVESLAPADVAAIRKLGLRLCYAATLAEGAVHAGIHAVPPASPLLQCVSRAVVVAATPAGEVTLTQEAVTEEATAHTMLADVRHALATPYRAPAHQPFAAAGASSATFACRIPYAARDALLGQGAAILTETVDATGTLTAVFTCARKPAAEGLVIPVLGAYEPAETKLRLVG